MKLSQSFSIDIDAPWVKKHNKEARSVVDAFKADKPIRVPLLMGDATHQHGFYSEEADVDYRIYYNDPDEMVRVQLEAARRRRELPFCDFEIGVLPESWTVSVDQHPVVGPGAFGCPITFRKHTVPAHECLHLSKQECKDLVMPDLRTGGLLKKIGKYDAYMKENYENKLEFLGRPLGWVACGIYTAGIFSTTLDLRGPEIMSDMYEDPEFAAGFLRKVADWCIAFGQEWYYDGAPATGPYQITDHGIDMLSPFTYEKFIVQLIKDINKERGTTETAHSLHHCGRGAHLFSIMDREFGLEHIDSLTYPLIDIARVRSELGEDVWIEGVIADEILTFGPPEMIRQIVKDLMQSGAKGRGRFSLSVGDLLQGVPLEHRYVLYESVKEFGTY